MPPSAITVCAFPRSDLQTIPTETPAADASIAARNPAPPAPITSTSCATVSYSDMVALILLLLCLCLRLLRFDFEDEAEAEEEQDFYDLTYFNDLTYLT